MSESIFSNYPEWIQFKATDTSKILENLADAYEKQKKSYEDMASINDDFWAKAQKHHQEQAINEMDKNSIDYLNDPAMKQLFLTQQKERGKEIGGYTNLTELDKAWDTTKTNKIADESVMRARNAAVQDEEVKNFMNELNPLIRIKANVNNAYDKEQQKNAGEALDILLNDKRMNKAHIFNATVDALHNSKNDELVGKANYFTQQGVVGKADFEANHAHVINQHLDSIAQAAALIQVAQAMGDMNTVKSAQANLNKLQALESVADKNAGTEDGGYTAYVKSMSPEARNWLNSNRDKLIQERIERYSKEYRNNAQLGNDVLKLQLAQRAQDLDEQIAQSGTWYQKQQVENQKDQIAVDAIKVQYATDNDSGTGGGSGDGSGRGKDSTWSNSFSGNKYFEEEYTKYGISHPVIINKEGKGVLNVANINHGVNQRINKILEPDVSEMEKELRADAYSNGSDWTVSGNRLNATIKALKDFKYIDTSSGQSIERKLNHSEIIQIAYDNLKNKGAGNGSANSVPNYMYIKKKLELMDSEKHAQVRALLSDVSNMISQDMGTVTAHELMFELGWLNSSTINKFLSSDDIAGMEKVRDQTTKEIFGKRDHANQRTQANIRWGAPSGVAAPTGNPATGYSSIPLSVGNTLYNDGKIHKNTPDKPQGKKVPYPYARSNIFPNYNVR